MNAFLLGGIVGFILALLNFWGSTFVSSRSLGHPKLTSMALSLGGFIARLTILILVFYGLSKVRGIHFQTTLVVFVVGFTFCLALKTLRFYREVKLMRQKLTD